MNAITPPALPLAWPETDGYIKFLILQWSRITMTMDKSLRLRAGMIRARNVLTRDERIARLRAADRWQEGDSPFGLAKVRVYKLAMKKKKKKKKEEEGEGEGEGAVAEAAAPAKTAAKTPAKTAGKTPAKK
jgi:small basic protein (TIGR04137 family)